jgi:1-acyl-sn-glycerol-3-phosphate acyltransferase
MKLFSYPITILFYFVFGFWLCLFHPIQWVCLNLFGYRAHAYSVAILNCLLIRTTHLLGTTYQLKGHKSMPQNVPIIWVANHQSMYDIPPIIWFMRKFHPKFVSKKELGKGIPSVSFNLRHGGSVLINRKDAKQAIAQIEQMGRYIERHKRSVVIFPEGTRSKTGVPKKFATNGLKTLIAQSPSAYIVPISINNSWKMVKYGAFPMGLGNKITFEFHQPLKVSDFTADELLIKTEQIIIDDIHN